MKENFQVTFNFIDNSDNSDMILLFDLSANGLWKIEPLN